MEQYELSILTCTSFRLGSSWRYDSPERKEDPPMVPSSCSGCNTEERRHPERRKEQYGVHGTNLEPEKQHGPNDNRY
ncbi:hypothetical protein RvY_11637 [Ramazzottius varieornatus]|uniref:Uncharacterized protein n=1 Tax=Ramazzottius varieornatus TaxID=947166 RepID=A0A1D1VGR6_RAMVA|nr:hypothetical protein RvY_11637 [Ramazzottius varieornatus]